MTLQTGLFKCRIHEPYVQLTLQPFPPLLRWIHTWSRLLHHENQHPKNGLVSWFVVVLGTTGTHVLNLLAAASCNKRGLQRKCKSTQQRRIPPHVHCDSNHPQLGELSSGWKATTGSVLGNMATCCVCPRTQELGGYIWHTAILFMSTQQRCTPSKVVYCIYWEKWIYTYIYI